MPPHYGCKLGHDDLFERKKNVEYEEGKSIAFRRHYTTRKTEDKIMEVIDLNMTNGVAHQKLAHIVDIDRKNLRKHMGRLIDRGWVIRGPGLQGKYYPATKEHRGMSVKAEILGEVIASRILLNDDFSIHSPFFKRSDQKIENGLFEFSNKIGAVITYLLIQAMNPRNGIGGNTKNAVEKDLNIETWIDDVLSCLRPALLPCIKQNLGPFLESISNGCMNSDGSVNKIKDLEAFARYLVDRPYYELNYTIIIELMKTFSKIYPILSKELEKIRSFLPQLVA